MGNMSYCRFQNTSNDLADCNEALEEFLYGGEAEISDDEIDYAATMIETMGQMFEHLANFRGKTTTRFIEELTDSIDPEAYAREVLLEAKAKQSE